MEVDPNALFLALIVPLYPILFVINRKIGKYDQVCREVVDMKRDIGNIWSLLRVK